jgi:hypothetical protein
MYVFKLQSWFLSYSASNATKIGVLSAKLSGNLSLKISKALLVWIEHIQKFFDFAHLARLLL